MLLNKPHSVQHNVDFILIKLIILHVLYIFLGHPQLCHCKNGTKTCIESAPSYRHCFYNVKT